MTEASETSETTDDTAEPGTPDSSASEGTTETENGVKAELVEEGACGRRLKVEIPAESVQKEVDSSYRQLINTIQLPGFRKGRVPRSLLERRYADKIEAEVQEELIHESFTEQVESREIVSVGPPKIEEIKFEIGQPLTYEAVFEVAPEFEIDNYKGLEIDTRAVEVTDEEVSRELESLLENYATWEEVPLGQQQDGDIVGCDMVIAEGRENSINRSDVYLKLGTDRVDNIPVTGLSEAAAAAGEGAELRFEAEIPEDFPREDLRGETVPLVIQVKTARRKRLPALEAEFLGKLGVQSEEDLRKELRNNLENRRQVQEEHRQEEELLETLAARVDMELPKSALEQRRLELSSGLRYRLSREGKTEEEIESLVAEDTGLLEEARRELKQRFILDRIADQETILVTEDEVARRIQNIALTYNRDPEEVMEEYQSRGRLDDVRTGLRREKVRELLRKKASKVPADQSATGNQSEGDVSTTDEEH